MTLTDRQKKVLKAFAGSGSFLVPGDDEVRDRCKELAALKLLRPQPMLNLRRRVGDPAAIQVAYKVTDAGREIC